MRFDRSLNYTSVNEDWRTEAEALQLRPGNRVLCVTGGGDRVLDLLDVAPVDIDAIDLNPAQNHLLRLKMAAIEHLDFDDYTAFLGLHDASSPARDGMLAALQPHMPDDSALFWEHRRSLVRRGVLYGGRWERHYRRVAAFGQLVRGRDIDRLFAFDDLDEQREWIDRHWDTPVWKAAWWLATNRLSARVLFGDPAFYSGVQLSPPRYLYGRFRDGLRHHLARDSFMAALALKGRLLPTCLPPYLTREGANRIRQRLGGVQVLTGDAVSHLATTTRRYTHFSLSDLPSFLDSAGFERLLEGVLRAGEPGARAVIRQFMTRFDLPEGIANRLQREPELEARLAREDRAFCYQFVIVRLPEDLLIMASRIQIRPYDALRDNDDALELERCSPQGESIKLSFHRSSFHRRAEGFGDHILLVAHIDGRLVGTNAVAFKEVLVRGEALRAAFGFDLRVHPQFRRQGVATALARAMEEEASPKASVAYTWVVDDNRAIKAVIAQEVKRANRVGAAQVAAHYAYQVYPTYKRRLPQRAVCSVSADDVYDAHHGSHGPFDFDLDPRESRRLDSRVGSWCVRDGGDVAACSAWDNRQILGEVMQALPLAMRVFGAAAQLWPGESPHVPIVGERLQSWYLYDWTATRAELARDLLRHVAAEARGQGIDFLYIIHQPFQRDIVETLRRDVPRLFAPVVPYVMLAGWERDEPFPQLERVYVDVRDV